MTDTFDADPNKGFVAFPISIFDLDLCPGAFRTLAELCRMANLEGQCWPSLAQLGARLGRSRAAVSGYISELREAGILETEKQKMANGYNYRLRYTVTFWKAWRKAMGRKTECSVKPAERPLRTKNHIHKKQHRPASAGCDPLISSWKELVGQAPYPEFARWPDPETIRQTKDAVSLFKPVSSSAISADIVRQFDNFIASKQIKAVPSEKQACLSVLRSGINSSHQLRALFVSLSEIWRPHWANLPSPAQLSKAIKHLPAENGAESQQKLLKTYLRRWEIQHQRLHSTYSAANVAA